MTANSELATRHQFRRKAGGLPRSARTRSGVEFNPRAEKWSYGDTVSTVSIDWASLAMFSDQLRQSCKSLFLWYAENASPGYIGNQFTRFIHFARFLARSRPVISDISSLDLLNYRASLPQRSEWYLGNLCSSLRKWHRLGLPGIDDEAISLMNSLRLKGNRKGEAVLTMDPMVGPYTSIEQEAIQAALNDTFAAGNVDEGAFLLAWLFMALGQRPVQYAAMKVCDVHVETPDGGKATYSVDVPRAKQRGNAHPRVEMKRRPLISQIGRPLAAYALRIKTSFVGVLESPGQAPLFPGVTLGRCAAGYEYHRTANGLSNMLCSALSKLQVHSERTGGPLNIKPIRFRRTFATRAAQEGHGALVIAEMLDHSDTQNVGIYVAAVPEIAARIDRAIALTLAPLAQAFKGKIIQNSSETTRGNESSSRIRDLRIDQSGQAMGWCGQHSFCGFSAPVACYTCRSFEPWLNGPHELVLDYLLQRRARLLSTSDARLASVNDRSILAVAQVICIVAEIRRKGPLSHG